MSEAEYEARKDALKSDIQALEKELRMVESDLALLESEWEKERKES